MIAYIDSSVLLRITFAQAHPLASWKRIQRAITSDLTRVECLRTIDRARHRSDVTPSEVARRRASLIETLEGFDLVPIDGAVLARAADPFPTPLGTLDAVHLASAVLARDVIGELLLATHDRELGTAALSLGFKVEGVTTGGE